MTTPGGTPRPLVLDVEPDAVFATYHAPATSDQRTTAVLICPPWGWDEVASYRARRAWAEDLAGAGFPTLRFDYPGTGDSTGTHGDPNLVGAWVRSVSAGATWLAAQPGVDRVAAIGLGLGGLLAARAIAAGAPLDDLVVWGSPTSGRAYLREVQAFAVLQDTRVDASFESSAGLPDGWREAGGFVMSAETIAEIRSLSLDVLESSPLQRLLLLDRDGMGFDSALGASLERSAIAVSAEPGPGWSRMVLHVEHYTAPTVVFERVRTWLSDPASVQGGMPRADPPRPAGAPGLDHLDSRREDACVRETPIWIDQPEGRLFGVLAEPLDAPAADVCAIFLNAGAVRRIGPNRLWVTAARRWSTRGVPTLRMDMEGIGDSDGDPTRYEDVGNFYTAEFGAQVGRIVDDLERRGFGPRFVLIGLCAGGYWAFHEAAGDARVITALIVNPRAMIWDDGLLARREARRVASVLDRAFWSRVAHGRVPPSRFVEIARAVAGRVREAAAAAPARARSGLRNERPEHPVEQRLDALRDLGTRVVLAFSGNEPVQDELRSDGILGHLDRWPNVSQVTLPGRDHTLRPVDAQAALVDFLDAELGHLLATRRS